MRSAEGMHPTVPLLGRGFCGLSARVEAALIAMEARKPAM